MNQIVKRTTECLSTPRVFDNYFVIFNEMVFEVALPFFGVTVTVTLHEPALRPLSVVPDTLQYFAELDNTFSDTLEVESTASSSQLSGRWHRPLL